MSTETDSDVRAGKAAFDALLGGDTIYTIDGGRFLDRALALVTTICSMTSEPEKVLSVAISKLQARLAHLRSKQ